MQCSVAEFVSENGWQAFRDLEKKLLTRLGCLSQVVIATGGGAVLHTEVWKDIRRGALVIWLQADAQTIRERLRTDPASHSQRPSLSGTGSIDEVETTLAEREPHYRKGSDIAIDTKGRSPEEIVSLIKHQMIFND